MSRSLNLVQLIGNVTKDPVVKVTTNGSTVATFSVATNRTWKDAAGQQNTEATFHRIVSWGKLAEICQLMVKSGTKLYIAGRLSTRRWTDAASLEHVITEVVADEVIVLSRPETHETTKEYSGNSPYPQVSTPESIVGGPIS